MLSNLPEPILCHVLSFLPTQTAVACSVLSKRWQTLWRSIPVVDFDLHRDVKGRRGSRFIEIVDKVFLRRRGPVKTLRLSFLSLSGRTELGSIHRFHFLRLEELDLGNIPCPLPRCITFNTLRILKLRNSSLGYVVDSCVFPKLSVLHLSSVGFRVRDLEKFLSSFPLLEELVFQDYLSFPSQLRICVPTLTSLVVQSASDHRIELTLDTPALEYLCFKHRNSPNSLVAGNLCSLRRADISCFVLEKDGADRSCMMKLLSALSSVEFLKLSCGTMHGLAHGLDYSYVDELPVFHNLVNLELCSSCYCVLFPHLLHIFPNIKYMSIDKNRDTEVAYACWKEPLHVPRCL